MRRTTERQSSRFTTGMQKKLVVLFCLVLLAFVGLMVRLVVINNESGEKYKKQVLSQQSYDSKVLPYRRGDILDSKGTRLAVSEKVYNVILDAKILLDKEEYLEPTIAAVQSQLGLDTSVIRSRIATNPDSSYYTLAKQLTYDQVSGFKELQADEKQGANIKGIWFEEEYKRKYPNGTMACDVLGFTTRDNRGLYGLEEYYEATLSGTPGREYGYLNGDSNLERTTIAAVDGNSIVTTIDSNIQSIVEKYLKKFDEQYKDAFREGNGSNNTGCIIMDVNTGEILAMASYPVFDLNNTKNDADLIGMPMVDLLGNRTGEYITEENLASMEQELHDQQFNALWRNFTINDTYEPGSVSKPFTVAAALDAGKITGDEKYNCEGFLQVGDYKIKCHNIFGDGYLSVAEAVERSCNVGMMNIGMAMGGDTYINYQHIFNFGLKTNIDLTGESRTASLVYDVNTLGSTELATNTFGQGFNVTMIQMITGFCSLINGGYYYEPHVVDRIVSPSGATVENIEPRILKQTVSETTSKKVIEYCNLVVSGEKGTGKTARPAGYLIGGKTGTAETLPRKNGQYVVSFMGYAPIDNPQIAIYVVVDRPNAQYQDDAKFATRIVKNILTEVLPYRGIFMTEELSDEERAELEALQIEIMPPAVTEPAQDETLIEGEGPLAEEEVLTEEVWRSFPVDPESGYLKDPDTGALFDPESGKSVSSDLSIPAGLGNPNGNNQTTDNPDDNNPM